MRKQKQEFWEPKKSYKPFKNSKPSAGICYRSERGMRCWRYGKENRSGRREKKEKEREKTKRRMRMKMNTMLEVERSFLALTKGE